LTYGPGIQQEHPTALKQEYKVSAGFLSSCAIIENKGRISGKNIQGRKFCRGSEEPCKKKVSLNSFIALFYEPKKSHSKSHL
jgi:hypothetical protein